MANPKELHISKDFKNYPEVFFKYDCNKYNCDGKK
jgi:hypothetical protein